MLKYSIILSVKSKVKLNHLLLTDWTIVVSFISGKGLFCYSILYRGLLCCAGLCSGKHAGP